MTMEEAIKRCIELHNIQVKDEGLRKASIVQLEHYLKAKCWGIVPCGKDNHEEFEVANN